MKILRVTGFVFLLVTISFLLFGCFSDRVYSYKEISSYVLENQDSLDKMIDDNQYYNSLDNSDYKKYLGSKTIVKSAFTYTSGIIKFYCGGSGLVSDSKYSGFYYSKTDMHYGMEFNEEHQTTDNDGFVTYHCNDRISFLKTKRICPHWFYYYMEWH